MTDLAGFTSTGALVLRTLLVGVGATLVADAWTLLRRHVFGMPVPDYALVGRWIGHMRHGRFRHDAIARATPVAHEAALGWIVHYAIGMAFAALLPLLCGAGWLRAPTLAPALGIGAATVLAPFLLLQPGLGAGLFARRTPRPWRARVQSLLMHAAFGLGLYLAARAIAALAP